MDPIRVHPTKRYLTQADRPFFPLVDTAWHLAQYLTLDEAKHYLDVRAAQGFNAAMFTLIPENTAFEIPNRQGHFPLHNQNPAHPNDDWFDHVDALVSEFHQRNLTPMPLPAWGNWWNNRWSPAIPAIFNPDNATAYGAYLGQRYRDTHLVWIQGGDKPIENYEMALIVRNIAHAIKGQGADQIMGYHTPGGSSSYDQGGQEDWLDFVGWQSGHMWNSPRSDRFADVERQRPWARPFFELEPAYENHPLMLEGWKPSEKRFDDQRVRADIYTSVLAGSCGHTYGCHDVWQFHDEATHPVVNSSNLPWQQAIHLPGASQLRHARAIFEEISYQTLEPLPDPFIQGDAEGHHKARAARNQDFLLAYIPTSHELEINWNLAPRQPKSATWFDPKTGQRQPAELTPDLDPPTDHDWLWILDCRP